MATHTEVGGPTAADRQFVYARAGLSTESAKHVERMIEGSGTRCVGKSALTNVRVRMQSHKNQAPRVVESHTCELVYAYELELDATVLGYYVQPLCEQVMRTTSSGRNHVSSVHLDFLVLRSDRVEVVECKTLAWLVNEASKDRSHWEKVGDHWHHAPYSDWAAQIGIDFCTWVAPERPGVYLQNLEACYALLGVDLSAAEQLSVERASKLLRCRPASIEDLTSEVRGFTARLALWMLASRTAHGPLISTPIALPAKFYLYTCEIQAREVDATILRANSSTFAEAAVSDPLLTASPTDRRKAIDAYAELQAAQAGGTALTKRLRNLTKQVNVAAENGLSPLAGCLTKYANSGNRTSRLLPEQVEAIQEGLLAWRHGKVRLVKHLDYLFEDECRKRGVPPIGKSRLHAQRLADDPRRRALATGGLRAYHQVRPSTDPRFRSLPPIGYGQVLYVDSSTFDLRYASGPSDTTPLPKATFYAAIDGCRMPMAHALIFGPARTDGLALLMREHVKRNGFLPRTIHLDRGSENTSVWMTEFCEGRISLRHSPTAASAWNGIAESAIKQINAQVAHELPGNTLPDQYGRSVDGRFKSVNQAKMAFTTVHDLFIKYMYEDLPNTPGDDGRTPLEMRDEARAAFGVMGTECQWNDDFLIQTSVRPRRWSCDARRGIRISTYWFLSDPLIKLLRTNKPTDVRADCCDPSICWVMIAGVWVKAFHSRVQSMACMTDGEKLFELLWRPIARTNAKRQREQLDRHRYDRHQLAVAASVATQHLAPTSEPSSEDVDALHASQGDEVEFDTIAPLSVQEDF